MNANEIRATNLDDFRDTERAIACWLQEIAAQLAEMNERENEPKNVTLADLQRQIR